MLALAFALFVIFVAFVIRGFSGFGSSMIAITGLSLIYAPAEIVPSIFLLELAASANLLPTIWKEIHWRSLGPLTIGCFLATPFGVWVLAHVAPAPLQLALSIFVLLATALLWKGFSLKSMPGATASTLVGAATGLANGAFGIGGPPVVLFYFSTPAGVAAGRASIIAFFIATDVIGLANQSYQGLISKDTFLRALEYLPALLAGIWVGSRGFKRVDQAMFRKAVFLLLAVMAVAIGIKAIVALQ